MSTVKSQKNEAWRIIHSNPKRGVLTKSKIERLMTFPALRKMISKDLWKKKPLEIDITGPRGHYVRFRIESPRKFDKKSFRVIPDGKVTKEKTRIVLACPMGKWDSNKKYKGKKGSCKVSQKVQSVLVPKYRVEMIVEKFSKIPTSEKRKLRIASNKAKRKKNPVLMSISKKSNGRRNPSSEWPFRENRVSWSKFYRWAKENFDKKLFKRLKDTLKAYKRFHKTSPKFVDKMNIPVGEGVDIGYKIGKAPTESYIPITGSKKGRFHYIHEYEEDEENLPDKIATADGKTVITALNEGAVITDWFHG